MAKTIMDAVLEQWARMQQSRPTEGAKPIAVNRRVRQPRPGDERRLKQGKCPMRLVVQRRRGGR